MQHTQYSFTETGRPPALSMCLPVNNTCLASPYFPIGPHPRSRVPALACALVMGSVIDGPSVSTFLCCRYACILSSLHRFGRGLALGAYLLLLTAH